MTKPLRAALVVAAISCLPLACRSKVAQENDHLHARVTELEQKVSTLEADNARLKEQIRLLTNAADSLSGAMRMQQELGKLPEGAATPTPAPTETPAAKANASGTPVPAASATATPK